MAQVKVTLSQHPGNSFNFHARVNYIVGQQH